MFYDCACNMPAFFFEVWTSKLPAKYTYIVKFAKVSDHNCALIRVPSTVSCLRIFYLKAFSNQPRLPPLARSKTRDVTTTNPSSGQHLACVYQTRKQLHQVVMLERFEFLCTRSQQSLLYADTVSYGFNKIFASLQVPYITECTTVLSNSCLRQRFRSGNQISRDSLVSTEFRDRAHVYFAV